MAQRTFSIQATYGIPVSIEGATSPTMEANVGPSKSSSKVDQKLRCWVRCMAEVVVLRAWIAFASRVVLDNAITATQQWAKRTMQR